MAPNVLKLGLIFTVIIPFVLITHSGIAFSEDIDDGEDYVVDSRFLNAQSGSRFLARIRKGAHCDPISNNICNGLSVNNGTGLLHCCKKHCRNILGDRNNCGQCGHKCGFGQLCCHGTCTNIAYNVDHCGKCENKCLPGVKCEYGTCGYA